MESKKCHHTVLEVVHHCRPHFQNDSIFCNILIHCKGNKTYSKPWTTLKLDIEIIQYGLVLILSLEVKDLAFILYDVF